MYDKHDGKVDRILMHDIAYYNGKLHHRKY